MDDRRTVTRLSRLALLVQRLAVEQIKINMELQDETPERLEQIDAMIKIVEEISSFTDKLLDEAEES